MGSGRCLITGVVGGAGQRARVGRFRSTIVAKKLSLLAEYVSWEGVRGLWRVLLRFLARGALVGWVETRLNKIKSIRRTASASERPGTNILLIVCCRG